LIAPRAVTSVSRGMRLSPARASAPTSGPGAMLVAASSASSGSCGESSRHCVPRTSITTVTRTISSVSRTHGSSSSDASVSAGSAGSSRHERYGRSSPRSCTSASAPTLIVRKRTWRVSAMYSTSDTGSSDQLLVVTSHHATRGLSAGTITPEGTLTVQRNGGGATAVECSPESGYGSSSSSSHCSVTGRSTHCGFTRFGGGGSETSCIAREGDERRERRRA
jgi:hypothetical protein